MKILGILLFILVFASACNVAEQTAKKTAEENNAVDTPLFTRQSFSFNRASATRSESNNTSQFRIERTGSDLSSAQTVFVDINGTADPTDLSLITVDGVIPTYVIPTRFRVEFAPNETLKNINLTLFDDLIYEGNEILNLQIIPNNNDYGISGNHQLSLEIRDDESYPIVSFQSAIGVTTEGLTYNLTVEVTNLSKDNIVVPINYDNLNSIAKMGTDIGFSNQSLTFSSGSSLIQTIAIPITNDIYNELSETAVFNLGNPTNANIGLFPTNTLTINNSGPAATYSFSAPTYAVVESGAVSQIQVNLVGTIENELRIPYTLTPGLNSPIHGNDYLLSQGEFVFPAGTASGAQTISLTAIDDDLSEGNENFTITLGSSIYANQVGTGTATVNIADNEFLPQAGIVATNYQTTEGNTFQLPFFITTKSSKPIVIDYTIAGTATSADHSLGATGTITIPPGVRNYSHPVYISPDSVYDQGDTIDISISTLTAGVTIPGANNSSTITINEAGALASVSLTANSTSAVEGSNAQVSFTLSQLSESAQTFSLILDELTALDGSDFDSTTLTTTNPAQCSVAGLDVTFLANQTSCTINIPLPEDLTDEPSEHFEVKILQPQNINLGSIVKNTVEIIDNDVPSEVLISFDGAASVLETIAEGTVQPLHFTLDKISAYDIIINFSLNAASTATSTIDFSIPSYSVTIPKGSTTTSLNITSIADSIFENTTETIILDVTAAPLYTINVAQGSATLNLTESTAVPVVSINAIPAPIPPLTKGVIIQNENNMANIVFKLDHASNEDIIINFATNTVFAECDSVAPFVGPEEFKCADIAADSPELQALINAGATVTIPAGSLEASLDFRILADNLFELGRDEAFELSIASIASANATIDLANDLAIISIGDSDSPSVARFEGDKFLAKNEATNEVMNIPFFLSTPSAADSTFKVEIVQASNPDFYKADENDFLLNNFLAGEVPFAGVNVYPGAPSSPVIYPGSNDVIFAKEVLIPAGSSEFSIDIELNHADIVYEETEQFIIRISQDDTPPAYYPYSVSPVDNEFLVSIVEGSSPPRVELTSTPASVLAEDNGAPHAPATIQAYAAPAPMPATTALNYEFTATSLHQHIDLSFDIIFSGTATYQESILTSSEYMRSDYSVSLLPASGATQSSRVEDVISFTLPAAQSAPATLNDAFRVNVNRDLRYELDETVKAEITNPQEIAIGANGSFEVTITNDDNKPTLVTNMNNSAANPITPWEYENENTLNYSIIGYGIFVGSDASSVPIDIAQTINTHVRQNGTITALPSTVIVLSESNDYHADSEIFPNRTGDYRRLKSIVIDNAPDSEVFNNAPFTKTINLRVPKMKIFTSKGDAYSGSSNNFKGHTCTLFRGRVMCFGSNEFGQLGMGSTVDFGGGAADDISNPTNRIQLGEDAYGHPLYVTELALGESHSCALFSDKKVKCWGLNDKGQLGLGNSFNRGNNPNTMGTLLPFIDLGVGVYKNAKGETPVMRAIKTAEKQLWEAETTKSYVGLNGDPAFSDAMIALLLASILLGERIGKPTIVASLFGLAGMAVIMAGRFSGDYDANDLPAVGAVLLSATLYAYNLVLARQQALLAEPFEIAFFQTGLVTLFLLPFAAWIGWPQSADLWGAVTGAALLALVALSLLSWAYARAEAQAIIPVEYTGFIWAALFGWMLFAEEPGPTVWLGAGLIVIGSLIAARARPDSARAEPQQL